MCGGAHLLRNADKVDSLQAGRDAVREALDDGSAYRVFQTMLKMQGVSPALVENIAEFLPRAAYTTFLYCPAAGPVAHLFYRMGKLSHLSSTIIIGYNEC